MDSTQLPEHVARNRAYWDQWSVDYREPGRQNWLRAEPGWGIWKVPESELRMLPDDAQDMETIELGCGTAYVSAWLARRGARPTGIDNSPAQLENARRFQQEFSLEFPLMLGNAESVALPDQSFDFAISEYGASIWCDPYRWIPEAGRLLRVGGRLHFLVNGVLMMLCSSDADSDPVGEQLRRPLFGMHRFEWSDNPSIEFHLPHGEMIRLLHASGFEIDDLIEVRPHAGATTRYTFVDLDWARRWPCEEVWKARKVR